jgi:hypothetical protein
MLMHNCGSLALTLLALSRAFILDSGWHVCTRTPTPKAHMGYSQKRPGRHHHHSVIFQKKPSNHACWGSSGIRLPTHQCVGTEHPARVDQWISSYSWGVNRPASEVESYQSCNWNPHRPWNAWRRFFPLRARLPIGIQAIPFLLQPYCRYHAGTKEVRKLVHMQAILYVSPRGFG